MPEKEKAHGEHKSDGPNYRHKPYSLDSYSCSYVATSIEQHRPI